MALRERGFRVRALVRSPDRAAQLVRQGVELVQGDLADAPALAKLLQGSAAVIHAAGAVRGACQADFDRVNVAGTAAVLAAINSLDAPPRLLLLSSLAAREPQLSWYAHSKRAGERLVEQEGNIDWLIIRPPAVYGPGDKEMLPVFQAMARGIATVPGSADARTSLIHVTDLVDAIITCLQLEQTRHQTLTLCDGKPRGYDWHEMAACVGALWQRRVRIWPVPRWLLNSVARLNLSTARLTGRSPMLTPAKLRELRHPDWSVDNEAITALTGWTPQIDLQRGLQQLREAAL